MQIDLLLGEVSHGGTENARADPWVPWVVKESRDEVRVSIDRVFEARGLNEHRIVDFQQIDFLPLDLLLPRDPFLLDLPPATRPSLLPPWCSVTFFCNSFEFNDALTSSKVMFVLLYSIVSAKLFYAFGREHNNNKA
ncbi:hypothetical protein CRG98_043666 [Punica granatum]|uniref:Uncharacterized protein n=1 Tax=Punica granatum TaxID=22663 RepID=A0A2I0HW64_PUNGR|nr:hypothetical protein CRG98_043666 [Punica granatum]